MSKKERESGLVNIGNTCYINTGLQILNYIGPLRVYMSEKYADDINEKPEQEFVRAFSSLTRSLLEGHYAIRPNTFIRCLKRFHTTFMGMSQEDSCEAFLKMIDLLHMGLSYKVKMSLVKKGATNLDRLSFESWNNEISRSGYSIIMKIFYGQLLNRTKCDECHKESHRFDMFNVLNFPITNATNTLFDSIGHYVISENMRGDNQIDCENCGGLRAGKIKKSVYIPPPILVFCFNRFDNEGHKISKRIDFPIDNVRFPMLFEKVENHATTYDLVGIGNHSGNLLGGHYWAYCRSGSRWIKADDETISDISCDLLVSSNAYYIVYQRRGINQHFIESS